MKRMLLFLVILATLVASATAQIGGRFAPKGTFNGDPSVLRSIASGKPAIHSYYTQILGAGWDQPGALEVQGQPTQIPVGAMVPGNAMLMRDGRIRPCVTIEGRTDKRGDVGYYVFNKKSGKGHWIKSCGQGFTTEPPAKPEKPVFETDFEQKVDIDLTFNFELSASAEASATATARGGNAVVYMPPAMPQYVPRRELARSTTEMYQVASIGWVAVPKMNQYNNQQQQQMQQQWQEQWQQQMQEMQQMIDLWIKNHGG